MASESQPARPAARTAPDSPRSGGPGLSLAVIRRTGTRYANPAITAGFALLVLYAFRTDSQLQLRVFSLMFLNATLAVGLVLPLGLAGLFSLSQGTAYGIGAYTTAVLVTRYNLAFEPAVIAAMLMAGLGGLVLGLTALRVRGHQWALVSMAATVAAYQVFSNWPFLGGREGYSGIREQSLFGIKLDTTREFYLATLGAFAFAYVITRRFSHSHAGRAMRAVGRDEVAASTLGVSVRYHKLLALGLGSAIAGLAGAFMTASFLFVAPKSFDLTNSFSIAIWVIVGGSSSVTGAALVAGGFTYLTERSRQMSDYRVGLLGVVMLIVLFARTGVFTSMVRTARHRIRARR